MQDFCKLYNERGRQVDLHLELITDDQHLVTFPYGIHFDHLCFLVNYCNYPMDNGWAAKGVWQDPDVTAWTVITAASEKGPFPLGCPIMLYVDQSDPEVDNVDVTAEGWPTYRWSFGGFTLGHT